MTRRGTLRGAIAFGAFVVALASTRRARATTYLVGPDEMYTDLAQVAPIVAPGDVVRIEAGTYLGGVVFDRSGAPGAPITLQGLAGESGAPALSGGATGLTIAADHYVVQGLTIEGAAASCLFLDGDDVSIEGATVHDCGAEGIATGLSAGDLTLDYVEVFASGSGSDHDGVSLQGTGVVTFSHGFVHGLHGGSAVASTALRTNVVSSWIEGGARHALAIDGDADVVESVLVHEGAGALAALGGASSGRYRFVNDTLLLRDGVTSALELSGSVQSLEVDDDALVLEGAKAPKAVDDAAASWTSGAPIESGVDDWIASGFMSVPSSIAAVRGDDAKLMSEDDPRPSKDSPLVDGGALDPKGPAGHALPNPIEEPADLPPLGSMYPYGEAPPRVLVGAIDVGAFEYGDDATAEMDAGSTVGPPLGSGDAASASGGQPEGASGCAVSQSSSSGAPIFVLLFAAVAAFRRRALHSKGCAARRSRSHASPSS